MEVFQANGSALTVHGEVQQLAASALKMTGEVYQATASALNITAVQSANASGSFLYVLNFMHLFHLFAGLIVVLITLKNSIKGRYTAQNTLGLELCSIYWHFLDILWVYLFLFLYFIR
jgi:heme/copper-type cytochrome/quinol oxidase subunit 3